MDEFLLRDIGLDALDGQTRSVLCDNKSIIYSHFPAGKQHYMNTSVGNQKEWDVLMLTGLSSLSLGQMYARNFDMTRQQLEVTAKDAAEAAKFLDGVIKDEDVGVKLEDQVVSKMALLRFLEFLQDKYVIPLIKAGYD